MLFNTAWQKKSVEVQPQPDLMSTASLVAWLEKKPADKAYSYRTGDSCLLAQYFRESGDRYATLGHEHVYSGAMGRRVTLPLAFIAAAGRYSPDHTFGGALNRLKAFV